MFTFSIIKHMQFSPSLLCTNMHQKHLLQCSKLNKMILQTEIFLLEILENRFHQKQTNSNFWECSDGATQWAQPSDLAVCSSLSWEDLFHPDFD